MLEVLMIQNMALIDRLELHLTGGLNVLTGETGAGKSVIIDAISLVIGGRAASDMVRGEADRAAIEAVFSPPRQHELRHKMEELGFSWDEPLIMSREILSSGRSLARINGRLTTVSALRELGELLVDIHGQHEHQSLLKTSRQRQALDAFGGGELATRKEAFRSRYRTWRSLEERRRTLTGDERERARRIDLLSYELSELEQAQLQPHEDEELAREEKRLGHAVQLMELVETALDQLYGGQQNAPAAAALSEANQALTEACGYDDELEDVSRLLEEMGFQVEQAVDRIRQYRDQLSFDPDELQLVQERLDLLNKLKRKYGATCREMLAYAEQARKQLHELENASELAEQLEQEVEDARKQVIEAAQTLHRGRLQAVGDFEAKMMTTLPRLGMSQAQFCVRVSPSASGEEVELETGKTAHLHAQGIDDISFLISTNPGEPVRPLSRVASGGELSRIMLALKSVLAAQDDMPTLIFDEIDAGVGGMTSTAVAEELAQVGQSRQVLCVTHLATIAAHANCHLVVAKCSDGERTVTAVEPLSEAQRPEELARMLGTEYSGAGAKHARELLAMAKKNIM